MMLADVTVQKNGCGNSVIRGRGWIGELGCKKRVNDQYLQGVLWKNMNINRRWTFKFVLKDQTLKSIWVLKMSVFRSLPKS